MQSARQLEDKAWSKAIARVKSSCKSSENRGLGLRKFLFFEIVQFVGGTYMEEQMLV